MVKTMPRPPSCATAKFAIWQASWSDDPGLYEGGTILVQPRQGSPTLKVAYFFSGVHRRASIGDHLQKLCEAAGFGLVMFEIDVLVGGKAHDLLDRHSQDQWLALVESGEFDMLILSPPCGGWSRANYANDDGPKPVRSRRYPWGIPHLRLRQQKRAEDGNEFIHFSIRAVRAAQAAKRRPQMERLSPSHAASGCRPLQNVPPGVTTWT